MEPNTKTIQIPANCLGQITCRANADWIQTATLRWTDDRNNQQTCEFSGRGEKTELRYAKDQTLCLLSPSKNAYSIECTFTFRRDVNSQSTSAPKVEEPTTSTVGRFTRIEIRTEDDTDDDDNDTWLTIDLLSGVDPEAHEGAQIDPSDKFLSLTLTDDSGAIATGVIVPTKYRGGDGDFQGGNEYWYLDAKQDYSSAKATSLQISREVLDTKPNRSPGDAILIRPQTVTWYAVQGAGPNLADPNHEFGLSLSVEGTSENNPQLHLFWYNTAARNLSLSEPTTLSPSSTSSGSWYVAE